LTVQTHSQINNKNNIGEHKIMAEKIDIEAMEAANLFDIDRIVIGEIALRPAQRESEKYKGLAAGIEASSGPRKCGVQVPILVRPYDNDHTKVLLVDGLQRLSIVKDLFAKTGDPRYSKIPINLASMDAMEMLVAQIQTNLHKVEMRPAAYGQQIRRMMALNPLLTVTSIAKSIGQAAQWVSQRISLHNLRPEIASLVDEGEIAAFNAFALAKLPDTEQTLWVERAMTLEPKIFVEQCTARSRELNEAKRQGVTGKLEEFVSVKRLRQPALVKKEHETHEVRTALVTGNMTAANAFDLAIAWALHQDPDTMAQEKAEWESDQQAKKERADERAKQREAEKAKKATEAAAAAEAAAAVSANA
jgi:hypothetical protein